MEGALYASSTGDWNTPPQIIEAVIEAFGGQIDLDPCSDSKIIPNVPAKCHFDREDNGLLQQWNGRVYMNSPYGREIDKWITKLILEYATGRVTEAIALVPARLDTRWFRKLSWFPWCGIDGRLKFSGYGTGAPFPSAVFHLPRRTNKLSGLNYPDPESSAMFYAAFGKFGAIYQRVA